MKPFIERDQVVDYLKKYREAYAEDLFTPIGPGEKNDGSDRWTTRVSGQMGRFLLDNLIREFLNLRNQREDDERD